MTKFLLTSKLYFSFYLLFISFLVFQLLLPLRVSRYLRLLNQRISTKMSYFNENNIEANNFLRVKKEDYDWAIAKYNMTDKMVKESIEGIRQWYKMQPHLPEGAISDNRLFRLLLSTGFRMEKVKQNIDNMLTARNILPEVMADRDPWSERLKGTRKSIQWGVMGQRLDGMYRVVVFTFKSEGLTNFSLWDGMKMAIMTYDYRLSNDICLGDHYVVDFKDIQIGHITQITPNLIKKTFFVLQSCFGAKIKGLHFINVPTSAELVTTIISAALSKKVASRVHVHRDKESLHKLIPKSILPSDLGGDDKGIVELADDLYKQLAKPEMRDWFLEQDQFKSDESKRIGTKSDITNDLQGLHGSFRTLDID